MYLINSCYGNQSQRMGNRSLKIDENQYRSLLLNEYYYLELLVIIYYYYINSIKIRESIVITA